MADPAVTGESTSIVREAPLIEAYKTGLLESAKGQVDATNRAALEGKYLAPDYQIAGMSQNQMNALNAGAAGIGAYQPYLSNAATQMVGGQQLLGQATNVLQGADTRNQYNVAQGLTGMAAQNTLGVARPINEQQIAQYMKPYMNLQMNQQLQEMNRQAQMQQQGMQAQAVQAGAFGGSREGIQRAELGRNLAQTQNQAIAQAMQQNYGQALNTAQQQQQMGLSAAGQLAAMGSQYGNMGTQQAALGQTQQQLGQNDTNFLYNLGAQQQKQQQAVLDAQRATSMQNAMQPYQQLAFQSDIYKGAPSTQMAITQQQAAAPSPFQQIAGVGTGILGLAGAANAMGKSGLF